MSDPKPPNITSIHPDQETVERLIKASKKYDIREEPSLPEKLSVEGFFYLSVAVLIDSENEGGQAKKGKIESILETYPELKKFLNEYLEPESPVRTPEGSREFYENFEGLIELLEGEYPLSRALLLLAREPTSKTEKIETFLHILKKHPELKKFLNEYLEPKNRSKPEEDFHNRFETMQETLEKEFPYLSAILLLLQDAPQRLRCINVVRLIEKIPSLRATFNSYLDQNVQSEDEEGLYSFYERFLSLIGKVEKIEQFLGKNLTDYPPLLIQAFFEVLLQGTEQQRNALEKILALLKEEDSENKRWIKLLTQKHTPKTIGFKPWASIIEQMIYTALTDQQLTNLILDILRDLQNTKSPYIPAPFTATFNESSGWTIQATNELKVISIERLDIYDNPLPEKQFEYSINGGTLTIIAKPIQGTDLENAFYSPNGRDPAQIERKRRSKKDRGTHVEAHLKITVFYKSKGGIGCTILEFNYYPQTQQPKSRNQEQQTQQRVTTIV